MAKFGTKLGKQSATKDRDERKPNGSKTIIRKRFDEDDEDDRPRKKRRQIVEDEYETKRKGKAKVEDKPAKKGKSKTKPEPEKKVGEYGAEREHDVPWCDKKVRLFKTLKQLDALSPKTAVGTGDIVNRSNERLNARDVRHYSYHAGALKDHKGNERREPLVAIANPNEGTGYLFYLTKSGAKLDPNEEYKKQEASKSKD